jgi:putative nucleotidyltransferase with HDIG domain
MANQVLRVQRGRIENISALPTVPGMLKRISAIIEKPRITLDEIGHFVSNDPALTTKVLKMVNSAAYGFPGRISSVSHAIMLLGLNVVKGLLLGISVFEIMEKVMSGLWNHSLGVAVASRAIAEKKGLKDPEDISIAGLLHDLGKVILMLEYQEQYEAALQESREKGISIYEAEKIMFSDPHSNVGLWLSEKWRFPKNLIEVIAYHHSPNLAKTAPMETAVVHMADILVRARGVGFAGDPFVPVVNNMAFEMLNLSESDIKEILAKIDDSTDATGELTL